MEKIMNRKRFGIVLLAVALLSGCGGSGTPGPPVGFISVKLSALPSSTIAPGAAIGVTATVSGDTVDAGVTWRCAPLTACGSFNPQKTGSGVATIYTAPATAPTGGTVTITALSVADISETADVTLAVSGTASNATLKGQYAFLLTAPTGNRGITSLAGSVTLDGVGNVGGGVADIISPTVLDLQDRILPTAGSSPPATSGYAVDPTGHGVMRIVTANGQTLDFSFAVTSPSHALLTEVAGNPASGTLDLQQHPNGGFAASQVSGGYSFTMTGTYPDSTYKAAAGGVFTADGVGSVSNGTLDESNSVETFSESFSGSFSPPDSNGRGTLQLSTGRSLIYYIVMSKALRIFEGDSRALMGGSAFSQGGSVVFLGNSCFYQHSGWSDAGRTISVGMFDILEGDSHIGEGISDSNSGSSPAIPATSVPVKGNYGDAIPSGTGTLALVDAAGSSTFNIYAVDRSIDMFDPNNSGSSFVGGAGNALLLHTDEYIVGTGVVILVGSPVSLPFVGNYSIQMTNSVATPTATNELDLVGVVSGDGSAHFVNGFADYAQNDSSSPVTMLGASVTGAFVADTNNPGRLTGSFTIPTPATEGAYPFISPSATSFNVSFYQINAAEAFIVQTDASASSSGAIIRQILP